jgi:hypothetical protein
MQISSIKGNSTADRVTHNATWATDRVEKLMLADYNGTNLTAGNYTPAQDADLIDNDVDGTIDEAGESGRITLTWSVTDPGPIQNTKTIAVTVTDTVKQKSVTMTKVIPEIF